MNTSNQNPNVSFETEKSKHHEWVKGVKYKGKRVFHPYTRKDFKFGIENHQD